MVSFRIRYRLVLIVILNTASSSAGGLNDTSWMLSQTPRFSALPDVRQSGTHNKCAVGAAEVEASWQRALTAAKAAFKKHRRTLRRTDTVVVINYDTTVFDPWTQKEMPDRLRVYTVGKEWTVQQKTWFLKHIARGLTVPAPFQMYPKVSFRHEARL